MVDLGYGASPITTVEMAGRLRTVRRDIEVVGIEIDADRVRAAAAYAEPGLTFVRGGFELGPLAGRRPVVVRAMNVLRQYDEAEARAAWLQVCARLADDGAFIEGTCDEIGRLATWVHLDRSGPLTLTLAARLGSLDQPSRLAERLPKALIHHNVDGQPIHALLTALDVAWAQSAPTSVFGARQRWVATLQRIAADWRLVGDPRRHALGEVTLAWDAVAPT